MRRLRQFISRKDKKDPRLGVSISNVSPLPSLEPSITLSPESWQPVHQTRGFFTLPLEIRLQILNEAFGSRTVHIHLEYRLPLLTIQTSGGRGPRHGGFPPDIHWATGPLFRPENRGEDRTWRWYSCICHRVPPFGGLKRRIWIEPCMDTCLHGSANCQYWPGTVPDKCHLGVMGFLLSSKQSYDELLSVLYSMNTFFLDSPQLIHALLRQGLLNAPQLMGPGIKLVTSLEMRWDLTLFGSYKDSQEEEHRQRFLEYLEWMQAAFPKLKQLYLTLGANVYYDSLDPERNTSNIEHVLLMPLMAARGNMKLDELIVSIPESIFYALCHVAQEHPRTSGPRQLWYPPAGASQHDPSVKGYLIRYGLHCNLGWRHDGSTFLYSHLPSGF